MTQTSRTRLLARRSLLAGLVALALGLGAGTARAQSYSSGQPVWPAFEGWEKNEDGTFSLVFGYMNDNWSEELDVPVGTENTFSPGPADRGQPTHFLPRRNRFIFRVTVPKDFGDKELVWSLTTQGRTQKAYGSLRLDLLIENIDIMSETGALGAGSSNPEIRADKPPVIALEGPKTRTVKVGQPLALAAVVTDDGVPRVRTFPAERVRQAARVWPYRPTVAKNLGLHLAWHVYRGAGTVEFNPPQVKTWEDTRSGANSPWAPIWVAPPAPPDGRHTAQVTFTEPGTYVLRARADDGALTSDEELTVTVTR
ncbi:MAG: hypothetical protein AB7H96_20660 [Vicinamibacterales bacterium]